LISAGTVLALLIALAVRPVSAAKATTLYTPPFISAGVDNYLSCEAVNVGASPLTISFELISRDIGNVVASNTFNVQPGFGAATATQNAFAFCRISFDGTATDVRASINQVVVGGGVNTTTASLPAW
jgi:hypothetical protein